MTNPAASPQIAFWFRYGPAEHAELFHCLPGIIEALARDCTVHYYGLKSSKPVPEQIRKNARLHILPVAVDRANTTDKIIKTVFWLLFMPLIALHCRLKKIDAVYIDETLPLSAVLAKIFFGPNVAVTITDFFLDIYAMKRPYLRPFCRAVNRLDMAAWRKLPLIFTRAKTTRNFLAGSGVPPEIIRPVYDPCDTALYHPADKTECRRKFGFAADEIILVHHGILHPNKGNDRIIGVLPDLLEKCPRLRFLLVGDGPEMPRLRRMVREKMLEKIVVFTGWLPKPEDVNCALNAGDIGLAMRTGLATDHFAMTGTLIHNMACALPVLAAKLRSIEEVIRDGENGFLFEPENMPEFKKKFLTLANNPDLRRDFGKKAADVVRQLFDMRAVTRQTVEPLLQLCKPIKQ
ncbi:MAG: glycosyltransferase [Kiritimatiellae bacterium]|jgi:glycosyltransferase involved in cell wall biosynthesis|nr:glycosyltransferase [Kiritimatiellia bacterium]